MDLRFVAQCWIYRQMLLCFPGSCSILILTWRIPAYLSVIKHNGILGILENASMLLYLHVFLSIQVCWSSSKGNGTREVSGMIFFSCALQSGGKKTPSIESFPSHGIYLSLKEFRTDHVPSSDNVVDMLLIRCNRSICEVWIFGVKTRDNC